MTDELQIVPDFMAAGCELADNANGKRCDNSTPQTLLNRLVKDHIDIIESKFESGELTKPHSTHYASTLLKHLVTGLEDSRREISNNYQDHDVLTQIVSLEIKVISDCLEKGCVIGEVSGAGRLFSLLKNNGTTFISPAASQPRVMVFNSCE